MVDVKTARVALLLTVGCSCGPDKMPTVNQKQIDRGYHLVCHPTKVVGKGADAQYGIRKMQVRTTLLCSRVARSCLLTPRLLSDPSEKPQT